MDLTNSTMITPARERGQHLHLEDRFAIKIYRKLGYSLRSIASVINCSASTVLNELRRGTGKHNGNRGRFPEYSPKRGQANYMVNRTRCHKPHKIEKAAPFINWVVKQVKNSTGHWTFVLELQKRNVCFHWAKWSVPRPCTTSFGQAIFR